MENRASGFVEDGLRRFLKSPGFHKKKAAIEAEVRAAHEAELAAELDLGRRAHIGDEIEREIQQQLKSIMPSPQALWSRG
jgi:hypothetical protein